MSMSMAVLAPGGALSAVEVASRQPGSGQVLVEVMASGICRADLGTVETRESGYGFPVTPGHEVAGVIAAVGDGVSGWQVDDRVAVGWFGGSCGHCGYCRDADPVHCVERRTPGVDYPGGWAEQIVVPADALARVPDGLDFVDAAPMGCAGVTVFNALRRADLQPGSTVAVFGIGGLGHLAVSFARAMGHRVVAIARGPEREQAARDLGASHYVDGTAESPAGALERLGGADLVLATASDTADVSALVAGLRVGGRLTLIGVDAGRLDLPVAALVMNRIVVTANLTGSALDIEETMRFAVINDVRPVIERFALSDAARGVERVAANQARFRIVLEPNA